MTSRMNTGLLAAGLCVALIAALLPEAAAAGQDQGLFSGSAPETAQDRALLFEAFRDAENNTTRAMTAGGELYRALQNPYEFRDPQAELENANTYKALQKLNSAYSTSRSEDNWYYWTKMWLNGPEDEAGILGATGSAAGQNSNAIYRALSNPFVYRDPQATLELANTQKELQKQNSIYSSSRSENNWYYWANMWLNEF